MIDEQKMILVPAYVISKVDISELVPAIGTIECTQFEKAGWLVFRGNQYDYEWRLNLRHFKNITQEDVVDEYRDVTKKIKTIKPEANCGGLLRVVNSLFEDGDKK